MSTAGRNPAWREAERLAERHARVVLARLDVRVTSEPDDPQLDLVGADFAAIVVHERLPVTRETLERLHHHAGGRTAACYARAGYAKTATLWAEERRIALFGYTDAGHTAAMNTAAHELVTRAQTDSEQRVRTAVEVVTRHAVQMREEAERRDREARAAALREQEDGRRRSRARRRQREHDEAALSRSMVLLLEAQLRPGALDVAIQRLALSPVVETVADTAPRLSLSERAHAIDIVRWLFDEAAGVLEATTPRSEQETPHYRAARLMIQRAHVALDAADGQDVAGHVSPDEVAEQLTYVDRCWRGLLGELVKSVTPPVHEIPRPRVSVG
ncbi:hypothetical protein [Cellulomonas composti]|uniref:Uncharacterized protein n=1 Tax=Cellulomonas composti TaxID=266130 RepID=A0A511JAC2_9CELL|nr:hypothetical protein [Cellulomonas composti]GEL94663.1 hypothetical protein CCO02nite_13210 [Cellulomonas composti]